MSKAKAYRIIIPARYDSSRLPGKPLLKIGEQTMIAHVIERARQTQAQDIRVATDDERILDAVKAIPAQAEITASSHRSGTDRIAELCQRHGWPDDDIIVNLQGDEPEIPPALIDQTAQALAAHPEAQIATLCTPIDNTQDLLDPNQVKVVRDAQDHALYFSRAPIPYPRGDDSPQAQSQLHRRHIGLYAYRVATLKQLTQAAPAAIEQTESLEQLRALALGMCILCIDACQPPAAGIDTPEDLKQARARLSPANSPQ